MVPRSTVRRHARAAALIALAVVLVAFLHAVSLGATPSVRAAAGSLAGAGALHPLVNQADNCIITTNTIPPTPLPLATTAPTANAGGPYTGTVGNPILFLGSGTPSRNSSIVTCIWNFGDGTTANFFTPNHVYAFSGTFTATLTVTDTSGATATASTTVTVGPFVPLCQQPALTGNNGLQPCQTSATCVSSNLNNNCQTICAQTGEIFIPGNCPGPSTGNQITITGPYALQVEQSFTVSANLNLPAFSDLANNDTISFDFGDGTIVVNNGSGSVGVVGTQSTSTGTTSSGSALSVPIVVGATPFFPAATSATHAYSQAGTYTIAALVKFSNGTISVAKTTATVTGAQAQPQAPATVVPVPQQQVLVPLSTGCNRVTLTFADGTPVTTVAASIQGAVLVSIYETPANAPVLGYFPDPSAPSNLVSVRHGDVAQICVRGNGVLSEPAS